MLHFILFIEVSIAWSFVCFICFYLPPFVIRKNRARVVTAIGKSPRLIRLEGT